jgi:acetyl-CoA carboxylase carboxyl transferase subunit beta
VLDLRGLRQSCLACGVRLTDSDLYARLRVCPRCRFHYNMPARARIQVLVDENSFDEHFAEIQSLDPLEFRARVPYKSRVLEDQSRTGLQEAAIAGECTIGGTPAVLIVLDFGFLGGSMGLVVGEKVSLALELAAKKHLPAVAVITSGGARIQEGVLSLMQMAKTVLAVNALREKGVPLISVLGNPATGQVLASFGSMADIIFAEPGAHIGFAPYRALKEAEQPGGAESEYSAESFFAHGQVDRIVDRENEKPELAAVLDLLATEFKQEAARGKLASRPKLSPREPWEMVQLARRTDRPRARDYAGRAFTSFVELHGDRLYGDDPSVIAGIGRLGAESVVIIGQQKSLPVTGSGTVTPESRGEVRPEGFRKAARAVELAARFRLPVISLVDTPGPMLGLDMEQRGLASAISGMINTMLQARVPTISVLIGEGGSEAALSFGVADRVLMLQNAIYTPVSPEDGAATEMRDRMKARDMAKALRLTSSDCLEIGVIDAVVPEPPEGAHASPDEAARLLRRMMMRELSDLRDTRTWRLVRRRQKKYRNMGEYSHLTRGEAQRELRTWRTVLARGLRRRGKGEVTAPPAEATAGEDAEPRTEAVARPEAAATAPEARKAPSNASLQEKAKRRRRLRMLLLRRRSRRAGAEKPSRSVDKTASPGTDG